MAYGKRKAEQKRRQADKAEHKARKARLDKLKSRSDYFNELQTVVNKFIRLRDKDEPCISCGRFHSGQWHAGHYRSRGACPELRFNEDNIHKQCAPCNTHKSGNQAEYRIRLIQKIGLARVEWLERQDHTPLKATFPDVESIKAEIKRYKVKCKELK
jgi:hypothetical protein